MDAVTSDFIPAVERIYRELARPEPPKSKLPPTEPAKLPELDLDDVQAILRRTRLGSSEQLQSVITNFKEYGLTTNERNQLSVDLTIQLAQARQTRGRPDNLNDRFIAQVLNLMETPFGLVDRSFAEELLRAGSQNIYGCRRHQPPRCNCWCAQRVHVLQVLGEHGEKSPEGWAAMRLYTLLEELECSAKPEPQTPIS